MLRKRVIFQLRCAKTHAMDIEWDDLKTVLALVRNRTLAEAGAELGLNYTTVARRITRAETALGVRLFDRLPGGYVPNETGTLVARHAGEMEARQQALLREMQGQDKSLSGLLTVTAPQLLIGPYMAPVIDAFCIAYPQVDLRIRATNDLLDLNRREADLAVRISGSPGDTLTGMRLCAQHSASFASPTLAQRLRDDPDRTVPWLAFESIPHVPQAIAPRFPNNQVRLIFDDMIAMIGAAVAGLGVVRCPMFVGRSEPGLVQVPVLPPQPYQDIWVVGHRDVWASAKVAAFRALLVPQFRARRAEFVA